MTPQQSPTARTYGMRLWWSDVAVIAAAAALTVWLRHEGIGLWWLLAMVLGHFFLFCNIFRVRRSLELVWAAVFVINAGWRLLRGEIEWLPMLAWQAPVTLLVLVLEMRSPQYHGVGCGWINRRMNVP